LSRFRSITAEPVPKHWQSVPKPLKLDTQHLTNLENYHGYSLYHIWKCTKLTRLQCEKFSTDLRDEKNELNFKSLSTLTNLRVLDLQYSKKKFHLSRTAFSELTKLTNLISITLNFEHSDLETIPSFIFKQPNLQTLSISKVEISPTVLPDMNGIPWSHLSFTRNEKLDDTALHEDTINHQITLPNLDNNPLTRLPITKPYWVPDKDAPK